MATLIVGTQAVALARFDIYFSIFLILAVPNALAYGRRPLTQLAVLACALVYFAMFVTNYAGLIGYESTIFASSS